MSDGKGKSRATAVDNEGNNVPAGQESPESSPLLDRIVASATGLTRSTFAAESSNKLCEAASVALGSTGKIQSASGGNGSTSAAESSRNITRSSGPRRSRNLPFRSQHFDEHIQNTEAEFSSFLNGIDSFSPSTTESETQSLDQLELEKAWENTGHLGHIGQQGHSSVEEQQMRDGQGVLDLLHDPGYIVEVMAPSSSDEEPAHWNTTEQDLIKLRRVANALFPDIQTQDAVFQAVPATDRPLNLIPDRSSFAGEEGRSLWLEQWDDVLTRYTDDVWGDLRLVVQAVREEVKASIQDPSHASGEALTRLRLILGHLKEP